MSATFCVVCGRVGTRGFVISSGNGDGTKDTYRCASFAACRKRERLAANSVRPRRRSDDEARAQRAEAERDDARSRITTTIAALDEARSMYPPKSLDRKLASLRHWLAASASGGWGQ